MVTCQELTVGIRRESALAKPDGAWDCVRGLGYSGLSDEHMFESSE